jgi:UDP-glucose:(heptosyl)LPS alpha-1,3-glucosyltransferase
MKIGFAIEHYDPQRGGAEQYAVGLARWLEQQGHEVHIFTPNAGQATESAANLHAFDVPPGPRHTRLDRMADALKAALAACPCDVVHGFNHIRHGDILRLGGGVHRAFEKYSILSEPTAFQRNLKYASMNILPKYRAFRRNEYFQFAPPNRHFIANAPRVAEDMARWYPACSERIHMIPNGIDPQRFNPKLRAELRTDARKELPGNPKAFTLLFASNNYKLKGLRHLIDALPAAMKKLNRPLRLLVAGRERPTAYRKQAERLNLAQDVFFLDHCPNIARLYAASDALVHPTYYDACANVCIEAAAMGVPVLTTHNNGAAHFLAECRNTVLVDMPCGNATLAQAIAQLTEPFRREAAEHEDAQKIRTYTREQSYRAVEQLYAQIAAEKAENRTP